MVEPKDPVLLEHVSGGRIAIVTLNRPKANNRLNGAITREALETDSHWAIASSLELIAKLFFPHHSL